MIRGVLQGAELWVPRGDALVLHSGAYGPHTEFARVSGRSRFRLGEGLPGTVWATSQAQVWRDLGSHFVRAELAAAAGIDAAAGFPWFRGRELAGVLTLLLTTKTPAVACVEVWNHEQGLEVLRHGGGIYVNAPELERLSGLLQFPYAAGLPGLAWSTGMPIVIEDVRASNEFVRADVAVNVGLRRGLAVPIFRERKVANVLVLLGGEQSPFPRTLEVYGPGDVGLVLKARSESAGQGDVAPRLGERRMLAEDARGTRLPIVAAAPAGGPADADSEGIFMALPVHDGARLRGVVCLDF
jgi:hypothetical protein